MSHPTLAGRATPRALQRDLCAAPVWQGSPPLGCDAATATLLFVSGLRSWRCASRLLFAPRIQAHLHLPMVRDGLTIMIRHCLLPSSLATPNVASTLVFRTQTKPTNGQSVLSRPCYCTTREGVTSTFSCADYFTCRTSNYCQ